MGSGEKNRFVQNRSSKGSELIGRAIQCQNPFYPKFQSQEAVGGRKSILPKPYNSKKNRFTQISVTRGI
jgi:hypothetical protein